MNDLTKHELIMIGQLTRREYILNNETLWVGIIDKIQSMIDNYCDHECNGETEIFVDTCKRCNAYLLRESYYE